MKIKETRNKTFDCLAYKDRVQAEIAEEIESLPFGGEVTYFRQRAESGPLADWWRAVRSRTATPRESN